MKLAFHAWNPFQIHQISEIVKHFQDCTILLEDKNKPVEFEQLLRKINRTVDVVRSSELAKIDGIYDAIVCQTPFPHMEKINATKLIAMQYSMTKERHQYGSWRALFDLSLVYGEYSEQRIRPFTRTKIVGNPRFDPWFSDSIDSDPIAEIKSKLDPKKKTILYLPTWGNISSLPMYQGSVAKLADEFNILYKAHHNTYALELDRINLLQEVGGSNVFSGVDDTLSLLRCADLVLSDYSGAIFDAINVGVPVILLQFEPEKLPADKFGLESIEYKRRSEIGLVAHNPGMLRQTVIEFFLNPTSHQLSNYRLKQECFGLEKNCGKAAAESISELLLEKMGERSYHQIYLRDDLRRLTSQARKKANRKPRIRTYKARFLTLYQKILVKLTLLSPKLGYFLARMLVGLSGTSVLIRGAKTLRARSSFSKANLLAKIAFQNGDGSGFSFLITSAHKNNDNKLAVATLAKFGSLSEEQQYLHVIGLVRAAHLTGTKEDWANLMRTKSSGWLSEQIVSPGISPSDSYRYISALMRQRQFILVEELLDRSNLTNAKRQIVKNQIISVKNRLLHWYLILEVANRNSVEKFSRENSYGILNGEIVKVSDYPEHKIIEFQLGTYLANLTSAADKEVHRKVCSFLRSVLDFLRDKEYLIVAKHQYYLDIARPSGYWPIISYHTRQMDSIHFDINQRWVHLKDAAIPNLFRFDLEGYAGWSSLAKMDDFDYCDSSKIEDYWNHVQREIVGSKNSKYRQNQGYFERPEGNYYFFPLQMLNDTVAKLAWVSMIDAMKVAAEELAKSGKSLVIKRHPKCKNVEIKKTIKNLSKMDNVYVTNASIHEILPESEAVVTVNSGVGFEALLYGKMVITLGRSEYGGVTKKCASIARLRELLSENPVDPDITTIKKFVWIHRKMCVTTQDISPLAEAI